MRQEFNFKNGAPLRKKVSMPKPKRWSHQDDLAELKGKRLVLCLLDVGTIQGTLIDADQFTLKMQGEGSLKTVTYFKSALTYYSEA